MSNAVYTGAESFVGDETITEVTIARGVTKIAPEIFKGCSSLAAVTIPDSVTTIGDGAFAECSSLAAATIPDSVTTIGEGAFERCTALEGIAQARSVTLEGLLRERWRRIKLRVLVLSFCKSAGARSGKRKSRDDEKGHGESCLRLGERLRSLPAVLVREILEFI